MGWLVQYHDEFAREFVDFDTAVKIEILALAEALEEIGPMLKRPHADTLNGSKHANMKELRFRVGKEQVWRVAYAFDPKQQGILLCGADKQGSNQRRFYSQLIKLADKRFDTHLGSLKNVD